ncbi:MAG: hypothetical protein Q7R70_01695 [Candidatus Diapherotrites archaeon]|nr:hypothetical protein [Candidatus Diapherotrites archaeon]
MGLKILEKKEPKFEIIMTIPGGPFMTEDGGDACRPTNKESVITENDIESYDWQKQEIVLTKPSSQAFAAKCNKLLTGQIQEFWAFLERKEMYSGIITNAKGLLGKSSEFAVMLVKPGEKTVISILSGFPKNIAESSKVCQEIKGKTQSPEIREFFKKVGKLKE